MLGQALHGTVITPEDTQWDSARQAWALAVDQQPAAVALPESTEDVIAIVEFAREHGLRVAPQGTGHNAHPLENRLAGSIVVKTERMRGVEIDPAAGRARTRPGRCGST